MLAARHKVESVSLAIADGLDKKTLQITQRQQKYLARQPLRNLVPIVLTILFPPTCLFITIVVMDVSVDAYPYRLSDLILFLMLLAILCLVPLVLFVLPAYIVSLKRKDAIVTALLKEAAQGGIKSILARPDG